jgi:hypothetical protein
VEVRENGKEELRQGEAGGGVDGRGGVRPVEKMMMKRLEEIEIRK